MYDTTGRPWTVVTVTIANRTAMCPTRKDRRGKLSWKIVCCLYHSTEYDILEFVHHCCLLRLKQGDHLSEGSGNFREKSDHLIIC